MIKKQWFYPLLATWFLSGVSFANDQLDIQFDGGYVGARYAFFNDQSLLNEQAIKISRLSLT